MNQFRRCTLFLNANGWCSDYSDLAHNLGVITFNKDGCISIDVCEDEDTITFLDDSGDFMEIKINYYTLVGVLIEYRQLSANYVSISHNHKSKYG